MEFMEFRKTLAAVSLLICWTGKLSSSSMENNPNSKDTQAKEGNKTEPIKLKKIIKKEIEILKWKEGRVPYRIAYNVTPNLKDVIKDAIEEWNQTFKNCIEWTPHASEKDYILLFEGSSCHSELGRVNGEQAVMINNFSCKDRGSVLHEMMHTIGFTHEHNRPDRDKYIKINFLNIPLEWRWQYVKEANFNFGELGPYDYYSLMHYQVRSPDRNKSAFNILQPGIDTLKIGQKQDFSEIDKTKVLKLYCP